MINVSKVRRLHERTRACSCGVFVLTPLLPCSPPPPAQWSFVSFARLWLATAWTSSIPSALCLTFSRIPFMLSIHNSHVRYNAGLPAGVSEINFEFTATSDTFSCSPEPCPGTYGMKLSVCELECEDSKHAGHAGKDDSADTAAITGNTCHMSAFAVLDVDDSLTFTIPNNS
jgi:hypothetical protein